MKLCSQLRVPAGLALGKNNCHPLNRKLFGIQSQSGCLGEEKRTCWLLSTIELGFPSSSGRRLFIYYTYCVNGLPERGFSPSFHSVVCLMTCVYRLPKRGLNGVRTTASSFNFRYHPSSLRLSSSCLRLLPRLSVPLILPSISSSITRFRRQFLLKMWPIQLVFLLCSVSKIILSSLTFTQYFISHTIGPTDFLQPSPKPHFKNFPGTSDLLSKMSEFQHRTQLYSECSSLLVSSLYLSQFSGGKIFLLVAFAKAFLDLISRVHPASCYPVTRTAEIFHIL